MDLSNVDLALSLEQQKHRRRTAPTPLERPRRRRVARRLRQIADRLDG